MPIELQLPLVVAKEVTRLEHRVYPSTWIIKLEVIGTPATTTVAHATFIPWDPVTNEYEEVAPRLLVIDDVFAEAQYDQELAEVVSKLISVLARKAAEKGVL